MRRGTRVLGLLVAIRLTAGHGGRFAARPHDLLDGAEQLVEAERLVEHAVQRQPACRALTIEWPGSQPKPVISTSGTGSITSCSFSMNS